MRDLARYGLALSEGLALHLYTDDLGDDGERDDLMVEDVVDYAPAARQWVAIVDWHTQRHVSGAGSQIPRPGTRDRPVPAQGRPADYANSL